MIKCPAENCGRVFESITIMKQHLKRRHAEYSTKKLLKTEQSIENSQYQNKDKLPKIQLVKNNSKQKIASEILRRSISKNKKQSNKSINNSVLSSYISQNKQLINENVQLNMQKKQSLQKRKSSSSKPQKLPEIKNSKHSKLQLIMGGINKSQQVQQKKDPFSITTPNLKSLIRRESQNLDRSKSKDKKLKKKQSDQIKITQESNELQMIKTQQNFYQKQSRTLQRPIKKLGQRKIQKNLVQSKQIQKLSQKASQKNIQKTEQPLSKKKIQLKSTKILPRRQIQSKKSQNQSQIEQYNYQQKIIVFKDNIGPLLKLPQYAKCQFLIANKCNLMSININNIQYLKQISIQHNKLKDLSFLNYQNNYNITKIIADHNQISFLYNLPINLQFISLTFNQIQQLENTAKEVNKLQKLEIIDLSFNPIRKSSNYKLHLISQCFNLKKLDGMKITNLDKQMAAQYKQIFDRQRGLVPSNKYRNLLVSKCSNSPSTVISINEQQQKQDENRQSYEQLNVKITKLKKLIKKTQQNLQIIQQQNETLNEQYKQMLQEDEQIQINNQYLYDKLKKQCDALQILNFLQYASEEQLIQIIKKKQSESIV